MGIVQDLGIDAESVSIYLCSVAGAAVLWAKSTAAKQSAFGYLDVVGALIPHEGLRKIVQFLVFITFGAFVAIILTAPVTAAQALAGGMAWSRLTSAK